MSFTPPDPRTVERILTAGNAIETTSYNQAQIVGAIVRSLRAGGRASLMEIQAALTWAGRAEVTAMIRAYRDAYDADQMGAA